MITYIVEQEMEAALRAEYLDWLRGHVKEMLALPGFVDATILARTDPPPAAERCVLATHYQLQDRDAYQQYLTRYAPGMRAAGVARFGNRVHTSRRVLERV